MAGRTLTSSLVVRLIDQVSGPARKAANSLLGLNKAASGSFGQRLGAAIENNNRALDAARGRLVDAVAGYYALKNAIGAPIKAAANFETQLEDIGQKVGMATDALPALGERIKAVARDTNQATTQIASAVDALAGRGASVDVALAAADPIGKAATAYRAATDDLAAASWAAVDNLKVPAGEIETALDMMAQAGKEGAFELRDMAQYFPALGAAYQGLGQKGVNAVGDLAAALQVVRKGTGDASTAATNLSNVLQKIYAPATVKKFKEAGINIRKEMEKAAKAGKTPIEAIADITNKALKGDLSKLGDLFEDAQVQAGMRALIQNMDEYRRIRERAQGAKGVVDEDFARRIRTAQGAMDRWNASIENISIRLGSTLLPVLNDVLDKVVPLIDRIGDWVALNPDLARTLVTAAAGLVAFKAATAALTFVGLLGRGGALSLLSIGFNTVGRSAIALFQGARGVVALQTALAAMSGVKYGGIAMAVDALKGMALAVPGVSAIGSALGAIGGALAALSAPAWGAIAVGVAAVAAAGALMWKYWDRISSVVSGVARALGEQLAPALEAARPVLNWLAPVGDAIAAGWSKASKAISDFAGWIGSFFSREVLSDEQKGQWELAGHDAATRMIEAIKQAFADLVAWAADLGSRIGSAIANASVAALEGIKARASSLLNSVTFGYAGTAMPANDNAAKPAASGHRARGGPVWPGGSFLVGEREPEVFTPKSAGNITPASHLGSGPITIGPINVSGVTDPLEAARRARDMISDEINRLLRGAHADVGAR